MRPCDDCRLCCKLFPLPVLEKPAGVWCRHACARGCAIHGPSTPEICRQYDCFWREHDSLPESWRPDRIGIVVTEAGNVTIGDCQMPVVLFQQDDAPAVCSEALRDMIDHFVSRGFAVMIIRGIDARIEFDRMRYPDILAEEIEVALRYELSQDAEELKRLGAVGNEYRPLSRSEAKAACRNDRAAQ
jgi:hypothetical protein